MSVISELALANDVYLSTITKLYGIKSCVKSDYNLLSRKIIINVLTWNQTADYLSADNRDCLEMQINDSFPITP